MDKAKNFVNNLLSKTNKLETDASPVPQSQQQLNSNINSNVSSSSSTASLMMPNPQLQSPPQPNNELIPVNNREIVDLHATENHTNNIINSTNNVFNFSHMNGLTIGPTTVIVNKKEDGEEPVNNNIKNNGNTVIRKTLSIEKMLQSNERLNHKMLDTISTHLGKEYKNVMRSLGMTQGQIEQGIMDFYINGTKEVIYQLLLEWTQREPETATLGRITRILWKENHKECVMKMKETYKSINLEKQ